MAFMVVPVWRDPDGTESGALYRPTSTAAGIESLINQAIADARRARGTNLRVMIVDDVSWREIARVRPKMKPVA